MGCVQSYFKRARNAGVSPSSTQESTSKEGTSEDGPAGSGVHEERSITEEPESNDTSYGVEATAVRTLAATTGTVAILGTTANTGDQKDSEEDKEEVETIPEEKEEVVVDVHEVQVQVDSDRTKRDVDKSPSSGLQSAEEETCPPESLKEERNESPATGVNNTENGNTPDTKSPATPINESVNKNPDDNSPGDLVVSGPSKEKEEDASKSLSSERLLKTNSISNTTLSSDSITEFENNSVKQSPSADKVIESFDSSSTVEFVDTSKLATAKANDPARSISSDLSNKINLPLDDDHTPDLRSTVGLKGGVKTETLSSPPTAEPIEDTREPKPPSEVDVTDSTGNSELLPNRSEQYKEVTNRHIIITAGPLPPILPKPAEEAQSAIKGEDSSVCATLEANVDLEAVIEDNNLKTEDVPLATPDYQQEDETSTRKDVNFVSIDSQLKRTDEETIREKTGKNGELPPPSQKAENASSSVITEGKPNIAAPLPSLRDTTHAAIETATHIDESKLSSASKVEVPVNKEDVSAEITAKESAPTQSQSPEEVSNVSNKSVLREESTAQGEQTPSVNGSISPIASDENNKAQSRSPFSSDNNSSIVENGYVTSPDSVNAKAVTHPAEGDNGVTSSSDGDKVSADHLINGIILDHDIPCSNKVFANDSDISENNTSLGSTTNGTISDKVSSKENNDVFGPPVDVANAKVLAAATTIQATFRGFQTRQQLIKNDQSVGIESQDKDLPQETNGSTAQNTSNRESEDLVDLHLGKPNCDTSLLKHGEPIVTNVDDRMKTAATTIQASFRGYQTRQTLKNNSELSGVPPPDIDGPIEQQTPTALTPELIESVKDKIDEICKEAELIAAERCESSEGMVKGVDQIVMESKAALPSVSESVLAVRGSNTPPSVSEIGAEESLPAEDSKGEVFDIVLDADNKTVQTTTTREFQTMKIVPKDSSEDQYDSMPNYPPPASEEEYLQSLEDLPPPDLEALESSYSEDVTEPLAPPPPLQDSIVFNEEDEDELMSLQSTKGEDLHQDTESSESSLSSAATKIQAGVRGYLTRRQIQVAGGGTTSTSTNLDMSRDDEGLKSALSLDQESEVCRHRASPELPTSSAVPFKSAGKRMSLGSNIADLPPTRHRAPLRSAHSVQVPGVRVSDSEVWDPFKEEMAEAATKIQSNFRGYRARKQLQREDAVQVTSSSSQATPSSESGRESACSVTTQARGSGEYHDMMLAVTPPSGGGGVVAQEGGSQQSDESEMVKRHAEDRESAAATKIQATFRGFKTRQGMRDVDRAAAKIQAGFRGYKVRKEMKREVQGERKPQQPTAATSEETAATKIQAGVRGFLVRRRNQKGQTVSKQPPTSTAGQ